MKLAFTIFKYFPFGGLQLDFKRLLLEGLRRGHEITVLYDRWEGSFIEGAKYEKIPVLAISNRMKAQIFEKKANDFLKQHHFDAVIGFNRMKGLDIYFAADNCFREKSVRKNPLIKLVSPRYKTYEQMEHAVFKKDAPTRILYLTEQQKAVYQQHYGTQEKRFFEVPPGVDPSCMPPDDPEERKQIRRKIRTQFGISQETVLLVQICSSFRTKGVDRSLKALGALPEPLKQKICYVIAGNDKPGKFALLAEKLNLADKVHFIGGCNYVRDLLTGADLMIHPAREEAAGNVLAEAIANHLPVICSGNCGYAPLVAQAGGKVLTNPFSQMEFSHLLEDLLISPEMFAELKAEAAANAQHIDFLHRAEKTFDYIEESIQHAGN